MSYRVKCDVVISWKDTNPTSRVVIHEVVGYSRMEASVLAGGVVAAQKSPFGPGYYMANVKVSCRDVFLDEAGREVPRNSSG